MADDAEQVTIERIERKGRIYLLAFTDGYEVRATKRTIDSLGLREGLAFASKAYNELRGYLERNHARYEAEALLARRPFAASEFIGRLTRKGIAKELIEEIVGDFKDRGLLDDYRFAVMRTKSLMERKPAGKSFLTGWLRRQGVPGSIAEQAVGDVLEDTDEVDLAAGLLEKKQATLAKFDLETARRKAYTYLSRRAISYRAAKEAFERLYRKR